MSKFQSSNSANEQLDLQQVEAKLEQLRLKRHNLECQLGVSYQVVAQTPLTINPPDSKRMQQLQNQYFAVKEQKQQKQQKDTVIKEELEAARRLILKQNNPFGKNRSLSANFKALLSAVDSQRTQVLMAKSHFTLSQQQELIAKIFSTAVIYTGKQKDKNCSKPNFAIQQTHISKDQQRASLSAISRTLTCNQLFCQLMRIDGPDIHKNLSVQQVSEIGFMGFLEFYQFVKMTQITNKALNLGPNNKAVLKQKNPPQLQQKSNTGPQKRLLRTQKRQSEFRQLVLSIYQGLDVAKEGIVKRAQFIIAIKKKGIAKGALEFKNNLLKLVEIIQQEVSHINSTYYQQLESKLLTLEEVKLILENQQSSDKNMSQSNLKVDPNAIALIQTSPDDQEQEEKFAIRTDMQKNVEMPVIKPTLEQGDFEKYGWGNTAIYNDNQQQTLFDTTGRYSKKVASQMKSEMAKLDHSLGELTSKYRAEIDKNPIQTLPDKWAL